MREPSQSTSGALDRVLELPHVSWPAVREDLGARVFAEILDGFFVVFGEPPQERVREDGTSLPRRRRGGISRWTTFRR